MSEPAFLNFSEQWNYFIRVIMTRRWTMVTFFIVTLFIIVLGTALQTPLYKASASVLIDTELPSVLTVSTQRDDTTVGQTNYMTYADYYRTQLEIIQSRRIANQVFENLELANLERYAEAKDPVGKFLNQLTIEPIKQTRMVKIHIENPDAVLASKIANEFAIVFVRENLSRGATTEALTLMKNEYLKLQSKEAELTKRYKDKFPSVVRVRQQMEQLAKTIEQELEKQLVKEVLKGRGVDGAPLPEELIDDDSVYRFRKGSYIGGARPNNIRVQDFAEVPVKRSKPNVLLNLALGVCFGILGSLGAAFIEEIFDSTIKTPEDIEREPGMTSLGFIPAMEGELSEENQVTEDDKARYQLVVKQPGSQAAEAYRIVRTNFMYSAPQSETRATIVTSPGSNEGKTTTAINLAVALAQIGVRILLVDADLRKPTFYKAFDIDRSPGLSEFLIGRAGFDEIVQRDFLSPGLAVVTSGVCPPNPSELMGHPRMKEFIEIATQKYDQVIFDTPPVIPVTDSVILAAMTRSVLMIAHSGKTPRQALRKTESILKGVKAKILGVVLNNVSEAVMPRYGYGNSVYQYGEMPSGDSSSAS